MPSASAKALSRASSADERRHSKKASGIDSEHARAALALLDADYILVCAGAGFSADSGLPVYKDIADLPAYHRRNLEYSDLCTPGWCQREPEVFFGFWGSCYNSYFSTEPHEGYRIISRWRDAVVGKHLLRRAASARTSRELTAARAARAATAPTAASADAAGAADATAASAGSSSTAGAAAAAASGTRALSS